MLLSSHCQYCVARILLLPMASTTLSLTCDPAICVSILLKFCSLHSLCLWPHLGFFLNRLHTQIHKPFWGGGGGVAGTLRCAVHAPYWFYRTFVMHMIALTLGRYAFDYFSCTCFLSFLPSVISSLFRDPPLFFMSPVKKKLYEKVHCKRAGWVYVWSACVSM